MKKISYIIMFFIMFNIATALYYEEYSGIDPYVSTITDTNSRSQLIYIKSQNVTIVNLTKDSGSDGLNFTIYAYPYVSGSTPIQLNNCEFVGDVCTLNYHLNSSTWYVFSVNKGLGNSHTQKYNRTLTDPTNIDGNFIVWSNATLFDGSKWTGSFGNFITNVKKFNVYYDTPTNDSNAPNISGIVQNPNNVTIFNIIDGIVNVTANITDLEGTVNNNSVYLNLTLNNTFIYVNGTITSETPQIINYSNATGDRYSFYFGEGNILSATYNIAHDIFYNIPHSIYIITGTNSWFKMKFFNVSNQVQQSFTEVMSDNATITLCTSTYYYCNENYTIGNPISNTNCALFFSGSNGQSYNHSHSDNSKHKILPMGIDTNSGTIDGVYVTPTSYILKRGTVCGDNLYYINQSTRIDQMQTSNNNGNSWTNFVGTVDAHIHQIRENESFTYNICASDNSSNKACSDKYTDYIDFPILSPNSVTIYSPIGGTYDQTLLINHSNSTSASGLNITGFKYEYALNGTTDFTLIIENNYPELNYTWDISSILNEVYYLKITVTDILNQTSFTYSESFTIDNQLTIDQQLLTNIYDVLYKIYEVIDLVWLTIFILAFLIAGVISRIYMLWEFTGLGILLIGVRFIVMNVDNPSYYYTIMAIVFITSGIAFMLFTGFYIMLQSVNAGEINKKSSENYLNYR